MARERLCKLEELLLEVERMKERTWELFTRTKLLYGVSRDPDVLSHTVNDEQAQTDNGDTKQR